MPERMHSSHEAYILDKSSAALKSRYLNAKHTVQKRLRQMKNTWWEKKAWEVREAADKHNTRKLNEGLRPVYGPRTLAMLHEGKMKRHIRGFSGSKTRKPGYNKVQVSTWKH